MVAFPDQPVTPTATLAPSPVDPSPLPPGIDPATADRVLSSYFADPDSTLSQIADRLAHAPHGLSPRPAPLSIQTITLILASPYAQHLIALIDRLAEQRARIIAAEARTHAIHITRRIAATSPNYETARRAASALLNFKTVSTAPRAPTASSRPAASSPPAPAARTSASARVSHASTAGIPPTHKPATPATHPFATAPSPAPSVPSASSLPPPAPPAPRATPIAEHTPEPHRALTKLIERLAHTAAHPTAPASTLLTRAGSTRSRDAPTARTAA